MTAFGPRFDPTELVDDPAEVSAADLRGMAGVARELEAVAEREPSASADFTDRVMAAIAAEPTPQPTLVFGLALRAGRVGQSLRAIGDAWRVALGPGRPLAVRGQALALALVVLIGVVGLGGGAAIGAARLLAPDVTSEPTPTPVLPSPSPLPSPSIQPSPSPSPSATPEATESAEPTESPDDGAGGAVPTASPTGDDDRTDDPNDDSSGPGSGDDSDLRSGDDSSGSGSSGSGSDDATPDD
jgi:cell division septation protein DedD